MKISLIVAKAQNNAIGKDNGLLWHLPKDMRFFRETTTGHFILTGRKNYFSIPEKYRPLKDRTNIVVTRDENPDWNEGVKVVNTIAEGINWAKDQDAETLYIIGGGEIYRQTLKLADELLITEVNAYFEDADTFFPEIDDSTWEETNRITVKADDKNPYDMDFVVLVKKKH